MKTNDGSAASTREWLRKKAFLIRHGWHCAKIALGMMGGGKAYTGPLWVQIGIANPCNHRCIMCWDHPVDGRYPDDNSRLFYKEHGPSRREKGFMALSMVSALSEDLWSMGTRRIELAGRGEPTLHPDFDEIVGSLKRRGFHVGVVTNGSRLTEARCRHLAACGVDRIVVSMNAADRETYPRIHTTETPESYDRLVRRLQALKTVKEENGMDLPRVMLSCVISRMNRKDCRKMIDRAASVGADQVLLKYAVAYPAIREIELTVEEKRALGAQLPGILRLARQRGIDVKVEPPLGDLTGDPDLYHKKTQTVYSRISCYIGWYFALITAEGAVSPCCQCMEQFGRLADRRFKEIWYSRRYTLFRNRMKRMPERGGRAAWRCACDDCSFDKINLTIHNLLHSRRPVELYDAQRSFTFRQLLPAIFKSDTTAGARSRSPR